ncbi:hypothetical protein MTO96_038550, partial [Rhipicephalus appendiculatus]
IVSKEYINFLFRGVYSWLVVICLARILSPAFSRVRPPSHLCRWKYSISSQRWSTAPTNECENYSHFRFSCDHVACWIVCGLFGVWYLWKRVFGTDVMVTVAMSFEAPAKRDLNRQSNLYFVSSTVGYVLGLALAIFMSVYVKHAQPALLYLVPACICVPLTVAVIKGDFAAMLRYEDYPAEARASVTD